MNTREIADRIAAMSDAERSAVMMYLLGWAQSADEHKDNELNQAFAHTFFTAMGAYIHGSDNSRGRQI